MENSKKLTSVFRRELTDLELMLSMVCLPGLFGRFPRNYKLDAMYLDICGAVQKFMDADRNEIRNWKSGAANTIKAREVFFTKLESLVEYLTIIEEKDRQAHLN